MFYKLMYKRGMHKYRNSYINILCVFILTLSMLSFTSIYCDSHYNYNDAVLSPALTADWTCDIRVKNITEEEAILYSRIPNVDMVYAAGNLDFVLLDTNEFETVLEQIRTILNSQHEHIHEITDTTPTIYVYYGRDVRDNIDDYYDNGVRIGTAVFQAILTAIGTVSMVLIYSDYIRQRTEDIRTLSAIGITERQLHRLFFGECNVLYLLSVVIGIPLGGGIAYVFFKVCEWVDMSDTNSVYPVFDLHITSLLTTALIGYMAVYITFQIILKKILRIDASYTCAESVIEFDPDKFRGFYDKATPHFRAFFARILRKRSSTKSKSLVVLIASIIALSIVMLNTVNYAIGREYSHGEIKPSELAAAISATSLFIMSTIYAILYSLAIVAIFTKRQMESNAKSTQILYALGADEHILYSCFYRYMLRQFTSSVLSGFGVGYAATVLIFSSVNHTIYINLWFIIAHLVLIVLYYFVYLFSMKKYFYDNCRSTIFEEVGG